ncbi:MAG: putative hydrolase of the superfamily, partial [Thermomicrobiales bacterium]|nr:putative hydrolase of the superfamily [Thermomicrobiales bacterium]
GHTPKDALFHALKERYVALTEPVDVLVVAFREQLLTQLPPLDSSTTDLLAALDDVGVPWGIVSNGSRSQRNKIRKLGLEGRTNCIVISEAVGVRKPDPAIFHLAAERLLVHPAATLFVGDHPDADIVGAAGAGMRTAWLHRGREWPARLASSHPHYTIDTLTDLYQVVIDR